MLPFHRYIGVRVKSKINILYTRCKLNIYWMVHVLWTKLLKGPRCVYLVVLKKVLPQKCVHQPLLYDWMGMNIVSIVNLIKVHQVFQSAIEYCHPVRLVKSHRDTRAPGIGQMSTKSKSWKLTVLFRTTPTQLEIIITWCYRKPCYKK